LPSAQKATNLLNLRHLSGVSLEQTSSGDSKKDEVLEGMKAVRLRPRCISAPMEMGFHHLVYEVVDNSVDEALSGIPA
jgi:DNA gyrase/topoisomerase IV subunit B